MSSRMGLPGNTIGMTDTESSYTVLVGKFEGRETTWYIQA